MRHKMLYLILSTCFLLSCISGCAPDSASGTPSITTDPVKDTTPPPQATTEPLILPSEPERPQFGSDSTIKVLAIGNSFSVDSMEHLWSMLHYAGYETVVLGNLHAPGCSLQTHLYNMTANRKAYTLSMNTDGSWNSYSSDALSAVTKEDWDVIVLQQVSGYSGDPQSYRDLADILAWVQNSKPTAQTQLLWNMTWAYQSDSGHGDFAKYGRDQQTMYNAIIDAIEQQVLTKNDFTGVIPTGVAIQNLRASALGDTLTRDGYHLSLGIGRYTAALTWYCYLTGNPADSVNWVPDEYAAEISPCLQDIQTSVDAALEKEFVPEYVESPIPDDPGTGDDPQQPPENPGTNVELPENVTTIISGLYASSMGTIKDKAEAKNTLIAAGAYDVHNMYIGGNGRSVITPGGYAGEGYIIQKLSAPAGKTLLAASVDVGYWAYFTTTEPSGAGILSISVSVDGMTWTELLYTLGDAQNNTVQTFSKDLTAIAAGQRSVYVKITCQHWGTYEEAAVESILLTGIIEAEEEVDTGTHTKVSQYHDFTTLPKGDVNAEVLGAVAADKMYFGIDGVPLLTPNGGYRVTYATWKLDAAEGDTIRDAFVTFNGYLRFNNVEMKDRNRLSVYVSTDGVNFIKVEDLHPGDGTDPVKTELDVTKYLQGASTMYVKLEWELFESPWVLGIQDLQLDINRECGS